MKTVQADFSAQSGCLSLGFTLIVDVSDLGVLRMEHGRDDLLQDIVVPDSSPVVAEHKAVTELDGDLAGVGYRRIAGQVAEEVGAEV